VFFQNIQYENARGEWVAMPLLIGRRLSPRAQPGGRQGKRAWLWVGVAGAALVFLALRLVYLYRDVRRRSPSRRAGRVPPEQDELPEEWPEDQMSTSEQRQPVENEWPEEESDGS
jgi:hypothetical protein